jgi:hypothetical protein
MPNIRASSHWQSESFLVYCALSGTEPNMNDVRRRRLSIVTMLSPEWRAMFGAGDAATGSRVFRLALLFLVLALSGCAATNIQRAEQLGALGKAYADAVSAAGDEAMASTIAFSLEEIKKERKGGAFKTADDREKAIVGEIDILKKRQSLVDESDAQVALLGEYFASLEQFAKQDVGGSVETATGGLADNINKLGTAIKNNPEAKATLSDSERSAIAKLCVARHPRICNYAARLGAVRCEYYPGSRLNSTT